MYPAALCTDIVHWMIIFYCWTDWACASVTANVFIDHWLSMCLCNCKRFHWSLIFWVIVYYIIFIMLPFGLIRTERIICQSFNCNWQICCRNNVKNWLLSFSALYTSCAVIILSVILQGHFNYCRSTFCTFVHISYRLVSLGQLLC